MNNQPNHHRDEALSALLNEWRPNSPLPPGFQQAVWHRIDCQAKTPNRSFLDFLRSWTTGVVSSPRLAATSLVALLVVSGSVGWTHGQRESLRVQNQLAERYVRSLDPYLAPRH